MEWYIVLQAFLEAQIRAKKKRVINKVHLGPGEGHFEMLIPQDVGEDVWIIPSNKSLSLLEPLQRRELFNLKIRKNVGPNPWGQANICFYIMLVHFQLGLWK